MAAEARAITVVNRTPSCVPALAKRFKSIS
jgi:hypothetical protein